nr:MAG TPA: hypothetical protein [Caudoviricetes sp.]
MFKYLIHNCPPFTNRRQYYEKPKNSIDIIGNA